MKTSIKWGKCTKCGHKNIYMMSTYHVQTKNIYDFDDNIFWIEYFVLFMQVN